MILYNVTTSIEPAVADEWLEYMRSTHIPEVMETGFFIKSQLLRLLNEEDGGITYAAQYYCISLEQLDEYQTICAPALPRVRRIGAWSKSVLRPETKTDVLAQVP